MHEKTTLNKSQDKTRYPITWAFGYIVENLHSGNSAVPRKKAVTDIFSIFTFFAKNYNLVNALSCVLVIFLGKKN